MLSPELLQRVKTRARDPYRASDANLSEHATPPLRRVAHPPVTPEQIAEAERLLGFPLPETLKQLYLEVGDGGFGPGYGLDRLLYEPWPDAAGSVVHGHLQRNHDYWPAHLLSFCDWGCSLFSFLDLHTGRVGIVDLSCSPEEPYDYQLEWTSNSLEAWMEGWVSGENMGSDAWTCDHPQTTLKRHFWGWSLGTRKCAHTVGRFRGEGRIPESKHLRSQREHSTHIIINIVRIARLTEQNQHGLEGTQEKLFDGLIVQLQEEHQQRLAVMVPSEFLQLVHVLTDRLQSIRRDQHYVQQQVRGYQQWYRKEAMNLPKPAQKAIEWDLEGTSRTGEGQAAGCQALLKQVQQLLGFAPTG